jgi:hypothetical protein
MQSYQFGYNSLGCVLETNKVVCRSKGLFLAIHIILALSTAVVMLTNTKYCLTCNPVLWLLIKVDISDVEDLQDREESGNA